MESKAYGFVPLLKAYGFGLHIPNYLQVVFITLYKIFTWPVVPFNSTT